MGASGLARKGTRADHSLLSGGGILRIPLAVACLACILATDALAQRVPELSSQKLAELREARDARGPAAISTPVLAGAVDPDEYVLGPGDLLEIAYIGRSSPFEQVRVSPSGRIHLAPTGPIEVAGLTLAAAEMLLKTRLSEYYAGTRITVDLLEVRRFRVHLLGHVLVPGTIETAATRRASDLLPTNDALMERASLRNLVLRRKTGEEIRVDLVRYRLLGDLAVNPMLEDGDVLYVPAQRDSVSVFGRVPRP
jgi:protein involved in polysaccharide export with SLBB domain